MTKLHATPSDDVARESNEPRATRAQRGRVREAIRAWRARTRDLHAELAALADPAPWWWLIAGGVAVAEALPQPQPPTYLACDAEPDADTLIAYRSPRPHDVIADAIARARAARTAIRELDGTLPDQALAVTLHRPRGPRIFGSSIERAYGVRLVPSSLDIAAFAIGDRVIVAHLDASNLDTTLRRALSESRTTLHDCSKTEPSPVVGPPPPFSKLSAHDDCSKMEHRGRTPFVCVSIGDEPLETARHGHRRAWTDRGGPWLGLGRAGDVAIVSTCHLVVDGYGHARLTARIAELAQKKSPTTIFSDEISTPAAKHVDEKSSPTPFSRAEVKRGPTPFRSPLDATPSLRVVRGAVPLSIAWREVDAPLPRVIPLAYRLGCILQRDLGKPDARFSPTIQVPVALGAKDDPVRLRRRVVAASINVRFDARGEPEPFAAFEARVREVFAREAASRGLVSRLLAAGRGIPAPLGWKRKGISAKRPAWLEGFADVIGGRALLSRISIDTPIPLSYAVSSPSRMASDDDPIGGCVLSLVDDGERGAITLSGSGRLAAETILDELLATPRASLRPARVR